MIILNDHHEPGKHPVGYIDRETRIWSRKKHAFPGTSRRVRIMTEADYQSLLTEINNLKKATRLCDEHKPLLRT